MEIDIYSRKMVENMKKEGFPKNTAVISFFDPDGTKFDYTGYTDNVFYVQIYDIDIDVLEKYGLTEKTYFPEADDLAVFIYNAKNKGLNIICQCQYGQSRSAACAAAILQHFEKTEFPFSPITDIIQTSLYTIKSLTRLKDIKITTAD